MSDEEDQEQNKSLALKCCMNCIHVSQPHWVGDFECYCDHYYGERYKTQSILTICNLWEGDK